MGIFENWKKNFNPKGDYLKGFESGRENAFSTSSKPVLMVGMGGSGIAGSVLSTFSPKNKKIALTQCTSIYPCPSKYSDIGVVKDYIKKFKIPVGLSDHTDSIYTSLGAVALGACIIEKHFTLNKKARGPDHASSIEPHELKQLVEGANAIFEARNEKKKIHKKEFEIIKWARESVVTTKDIKKGEILSEQNISVKRPAPKKGIIPAKSFRSAIGKRAKLNLRNNKQLKWAEII